MLADAEHLHLARRLMRFSTIPPTPGGAMAPGDVPAPVALADRETAGLAGKFAPQRLPVGAVSRPKLIESLRAGRDAALTLVCAPAGYGKTTLLTEWVDTSAVTDPGTAFAWVSLDSGDAELVRFWTSVIAACARSVPGIGARALEVMRAAPTRIVDASLPLLLEDLAQLTAPMVLILDDFHRAETREINETMAQLLSNHPSTIQVVLATRSDPALGIPRTRASGQLVEVRADMLAFAEDEAHEFLVGMGVTDLPPEDERDLLSRAAGWPAPLRIATLLMPTDRRGEFIRSFTGGQHQVVDYLTTDVLDVLPDDRREFLLLVSVLGRMNGSLRLIHIPVR